MKYVDDVKFKPYSKSVTIPIPREMMMDSNFPFPLEEYTMYKNNGEKKQKGNSTKGVTKELKPFIVEIVKDKIIIRRREEFDDAEPEQVAR